MGAIIGNLNADIGRSPSYFKGINALILHKSVFLCRNVALHGYGKVTVPMRRDLPVRVRQCIMRPKSSVVATCGSGLNRRVSRRGGINHDNDFASRFA
jgi:hypothetical protein